MSMFFSLGHDLKHSADAVAGGGPASAAPNHVTEKDREQVLALVRESLAPGRACHVVRNITGGVQLESSRFAGKELGLTAATHSALKLGLIDESIVDGLRAIAVEQPTRYQAVLRAIFEFAQEVSWRITVLESAKGYTQHPDVAPLYKQAEALAASPKITGDLFPRLKETLKAIEQEEHIRPRIQHYFPGYYDAAVKDLPLQERKKICDQIGQNLHALETWVVPGFNEIGGFVEYHTQIKSLLAVFETVGVVPVGEQSSRVKAFVEGVEKSLAFLASVPLRAGVPMPTTPQQLSELVSNWRSIKSIRHDLMQLRGPKRISESGVHGL